MSGYQHLELFVYLSDVTAETAATRMVSRRLTGEIPTERTYLSPADYPHLYEAEVPAVGARRLRPGLPARRVPPRRAHDGARRGPLHAARLVQAGQDTDWLGSQAWPGAAEGMAWHRFMQRANVRQLSMLGFPDPGPPVLERGDAARGGGAATRCST